MKKQSILLLAGGAILAGLLLLKKQPVRYYPPVSGNPVKDNKAAEILAAVAAAGATAQAIAKLIEQIKGMSESQTSSYYNQVSAGGGTPSYLPDGSVIDYSNYA